VGAVSFPIIAVAENWDVDATLALTVTVTDELTGSSYTGETWVDTLPAFPGQDSASGNDPVVPPRAASDGKGPSGSVRLVLPQTGQAVMAARFRIVALGENWGVETYLHIAVEVADVVTGHLAYVSCRCSTHPPFHGQVSQESF